jgi:hypothetical protein
VSLLDADGQAFASKPDDVIIEFASSDSTVAGFTVSDDGMNGDISSGLVGSAIITASVLMPDGGTFTDTVSVAVQNSTPGSANFTVGTPVDE